MSEIIWSTSHTGWGRRLSRRTGLEIDALVIPQERRLGPYGLFFFARLPGDNRFLDWGYEATILGWCLILWKFSKRKAKA